MPNVKVSKEQIIQVSCEIVKQDGLDALNARRIAYELGGSVQLIYHNFETMDDLISSVRQSIQWFYEGAMNAIEDPEHPYLAKGLSYVRFARDYPEYFKIILQSMHEISLDDLLAKDLVTLTTMNTIDKVFPMNAGELKEFHKRVWIFTHGIACLLSTRSLKMSDEEIKNLIVSTTWNIYQGRKMEAQCQML